MGHPPGYPPGYPPVYPDAFPALYPPGYPPVYPAAPKPPLNTADVVGSVLLLVFTVIIAGAGAVMGLFSLAFLDHCPPATCSVGGAVTAVMGTLGFVALLGLTGLVLTVVRLSSRKAGWPFALGTLGLCVAVFILGGFAYAAAVG